MSTPEPEAKSAGPFTGASTEAAAPTPKPEAPKPEAPAEPVHLPDDHPLVTTLASQKETIRELKAQAQSRAEGERTAEERLAALEERAKSAERAASVSRVQVRFGINDEDAHLFLVATDEETLLKQAQRLAARDEAAGKPRSPKPDPNQGRSNHSPASTADQFAAALGDRLNR